MYRSFSQTVHHYRLLQSAAHRYVVDAANRNRIVAAPLRVGFIDDGALDAWAATWAGRRDPAAAGGWSWPVLHARLRRPSAFHLAIWSGPVLCGLALGRVSKTRPVGRKHTVSVDFMEGAPFPHPLRGSIALLTVAFAEAYGRAVGARRLRLVQPLPGAMPIYLRLGFDVVHSGGRAIYCDRRIDP